MVPDRGRYNFVVHCNCAGTSREPGVERSSSVVHVRHKGMERYIARRLSTDWAPSLLRNSDLPVDFRFTAGRDSEWRATVTPALASIDHDHGVCHVPSIMMRPLRLRRSG